MTPVFWMAGTSLGSFALIAIWFDRKSAAAMFFGMLGPLAMALVTWLVTERTFRGNPDRVTAVMAGAFGVKMLFVGLYLALMLRVAGVPPPPFVASFVGYFVLLYVLEALYLKRLFAGSHDRGAR